MGVLRRRRRPPPRSALAIGAALCTCVVVVWAGWLWWLPASADDVVLPAVVEASAPGRDALSAETRHALGAMLNSCGFSSGADVGPLLSVLAAAGVRDRADLSYLDEDVVSRGLDAHASALTIVQKRRLAREFAKKCVSSKPPRGRLGALAASVWKLHGQGGKGGFHRHFSTLESFRSTRESDEVTWSRRSQDHSERRDDLQEAVSNR